MRPVENLDLPCVRGLGASRGVQNACRVTLFALLVLAAYTGARRHFGRAAPEPDFEYFYRAGEVLLRHGALDPGWGRNESARIERRGTIEWYLPFTYRLMTLFAWLPPRSAAGLWLALNLSALFGTAWLTGRHFSGMPPEQWTLTQLIPLVVLAGFWYWEFGLGQVNCLTLCLLMLFYVTLERGREALSGFWLALAMLIKLTPGLLLVWLLLKRRYRAATVTLVTAAALGPAADAVVFGSREALDIYTGWVTRTLDTGSTRAIILGDTETDWRNQTPGAVLMRWLHPTNYNVRWYNDPRLGDWNPPLYMNAANLPRTQVALIATVLTLAGLAVLLWVGRRPAARLSTWELRIEFALFVTAMLWLMPVVRRYHLIWLYPGMALLGAAIVALTPRAAFSRFAIALFVLLVLSQISFVQRAATLHEAAGLLLLNVILISFALGWLLRQARRGRLPVCAAPGAPANAPSTIVEPIREARGNQAAV